MDKIACKKEGSLPAALCSCAFVRLELRPDGRCEQNMDFNEFSASNLQRFDVPLTSLTRTIPIYLRV